MPVHDWKRVGAGIFHDFHNTWIVELKNALNAGLLPSGYYALSEQRSGQILPDVLTLQAGEPTLGSPVPDRATAVAEAPPQVSTIMTPAPEAWYALKRKTLTIRHSSDHRIIALVEIVSPANKARRSALSDFIDKALSALRQGYHLLLVDLFPPGSHDPHGIHAAIWTEIADEAYELPKDQPLILASYAAGVVPSAYVEPIAVGTVLPDMPLFLDPDYYISVPLEKTYEAAYRGVPDIWRDVIEGSQ